MTTATSFLPLLKQYFGYDSFRPLQAEVIEAIIARRDVVVIMPTGGGKSVCFQIPALALPGLTVVVSPLIALMKDQVEGLQLNGIPAAYINSTQNSAEQMHIERLCRLEEIKLLYVSPEKLNSPSFHHFLESININFFAIDEAHCISSWGHDFRPDYIQLSSIKERFPNVPVAALTATADRLTRTDIADQLRLQDPATFFASFDRPNLFLDVRSGIKRAEQIIALLKKNPTHAGIIYCNSRNTTESVADRLRTAGFSAAAYHAGMENVNRSRVQEAFLRDDLRIICATVAFGMGIDKSNVRFVIHYNMPKNIEGFYQEIGRAGRDGQPAQTVLFYSFADVKSWRERLGNDSPGNLELQLAKLNRIQQYAEAHSCRRRILLSYFSEKTTADCRNCDVCRNPRTTFDGTMLAQKALSAVIRLDEKVNLNTVIEVLRGSQNQTIRNNGYDKIKTYGAGADLKFEEWRSYLLQLINNGVLEIAYDQRHALRRGPLADAVLKNQTTVQLVKLETAAKHQAEQVEVTKALNAKPAAAAKPGIIRGELFEHLRKARKQLADEMGLPPYLIFSDATLSEMAQQRPQTKIAMSLISGVGRMKLEQFGDAFLNAIAQFLDKVLPDDAYTTPPPPPKSQFEGKTRTHRVTYQFYKEGNAPEDIARERGLAIGTIIVHLIQCYEEGMRVSLSDFVTPDEQAEIAIALNEFGTQQMRPVFDHFEGRYAYWQLRLVGALMG